MTITLPLEPQKEAKLIALAESKGLTADEAGETGNRHDHRRKAGSSSP